MALVSDQHLFSDESYPWKIWRSPTAKSQYYKIIEARISPEKFKWEVMTYFDLQYGPIRQYSIVVNRKKAQIWLH